MKGKVTVELEEGTKCSCVFNLPSELVLVNMGVKNSKIKLLEIFNNQVKIAAQYSMRKIFKVLVGGAIVIKHEKGVYCIKDLNDVDNMPEEAKQEISRRMKLNLID